MTSYASEYPDLSFDTAFRHFFEEFYQTSDTPDAHEKYAEAFTQNATLIMASKTVRGRDEILALRKGMWEKVASRHHKPLKVFPHGSNSDEAMLYGTVDYTYKDGKGASVDWAARACLQKEEGVVRMSFYQVYLDTAAQNAAK